MRAGVTIIDPATTWIDADVSIGQDSLIQPNVQLLGATTIATDAQIGPDVTLESCEVGAGAHIRRAEAHHAVIGAGATVGPYSYLRPGTVLGAIAKGELQVRIGARYPLTDAAAAHRALEGRSTVGKLLLIP